MILIIITIIITIITIIAMMLIIMIHTHRVIFRLCRLSIPKLCLNVGFTTVLFEPTN